MLRLRVVEDGDRVAVGYADHPALDDPRVTRWTRRCRESAKVSARGWRSRLASYLTLSDELIGKSTARCERVGPQSRVTHLTNSYRPSSAPHGPRRRSFNYCCDATSLLQPLPEPGSTQDPLATHFPSGAWRR